MVDREPKAGRFVLLNPFMYGQLVAPGGQITKVTEHRVYFIDDMTSLETFRLRQYICCVADTKEEYEAVLAFSQKCWEKHNALKIEHLKAFKDRFL